MGSLNSAWWCGSGASTRAGLGWAVVRTFRLATRSAVSRRVNWLIWSTMVEILGLTAASVELYLRVMRCCCWRRELEAARIGAARSWRAQHCAAYLQDSDMAGDIAFEEELATVGIGRLGRRAVGLALRWGACCCRESRGFFRRRSKSLPARG